MAAILVVEDDPTTAREIETELKAAGHEVTLAANGSDALAAMDGRTFDALTLDRMLPDMDGLAIVEALRHRGVRTPVLMISALSDVGQRIAGLRAGGDDYLIKPFDGGEMAIRIEALLRRASPEQETAIDVGDIHLDLLSHEVRIAGRPIHLMPMEYRLLEFLARHAGQIVSRRVLFEQVWKYRFDPGANLINVHVARLRRRLDGQTGSVTIGTIKGEGYRLDVA